MRRFIPKIVRDETIEQNWDLFLDTNRRPYSGMDDPALQDLLEEYELDEDEARRQSGDLYDDSGVFDGHGMSLVSPHVLFC
jgi:hypothetical protein